MSESNNSENKKTHILYPYYEEHVPKQPVILPKSEPYHSKRYIVKHSDILSPTQTFAVLGGIIMLLIGIASLIAPGSVENLPVLKLETSYGEFFNLFPMNILNKLALIAFGVTGIMYCSKEASSVIWSRSVFYVMGLAAVLGLIRITSTFFGYWPLYGGEVFAHGLFALLGLFFGYKQPLEPERINNDHEVISVEEIEVEPVD
jgi:hypothetical protein